VRLNQPEVKENVIRDSSLVLERLNAEFANNMEQANQALSAGETRRASDLMAQSRLIVAQNRQWLNQQTYTELNARIDDMNRQIEEKRSAIEMVEAESRQKQQALRTEQAERTRQSEKDRKINESIDRARALQAERKYDEALQVVDQILFLDPENGSGLILRDAISANRIFIKSAEIAREGKNRRAGLQLDTAEDMLPPRGMMDYPLDWQQKSLDRGGLSEFYETPENRRVLAQLENRRAPAQFNDVQLADVVKYLVATSDVDIDADWNSLASVGVKQDTTVNLNISAQIPIRVILDKVVQKISGDQYSTSKAGWAVEDGILRIASDEELRKNTSLVIYDISDLLFEVPNYRTVPQIDLQSLLQQSQGSGGGQSPFDDNDDDNQDQEDEELQARRQERINLIRDIITANIDPEGWRDAGGETGTISELNNTFLIRNTPRNHREIVGLLSKIREVRSMQINVETKFLLVNQSWFEQIGFDIDLVINANNNQVRSAQQVTPGTQASDFFNFSGAGPGGRRGRWAGRCTSSPTATRPTPARRPTRSTR